MAVAAAPPVSTVELRRLEALRPVLSLERKTAEEASLKGKALDVAFDDVDRLVDGLTKYLETAALELGVGKYACGERHDAYDEDRQARCQRLADLLGNFIFDEEE